MKIVNKNFRSQFFLSAIVSILSTALLLTVTQSCAAQSQNPAPQAEGSRVEYSSFPSSALGHELKFAVQLPPSYDKDPKRKYPVLYFLHGMFGSEVEFERRGVAAAINRIRESGKIGEMIIVSPAGKNSFYLNAKNGEKYEDAIIKDLIPYIEKTYRTYGTADMRAIQGISMGGFGALTLAFKHPEMFSSVSAHCAALFAELPAASGTDQRSQFRAKLVGDIFGNPPDEEFFKQNNPMDVAISNAAAIKKSGIQIYFDVGEQDRYGFAEPNKDFDARLTKAGIAHKFNLFPGNHGWEYMISVAENSYTFLWNSFKGNKSAATRAGK